MLLGGHLALGQARAALEVALVLGSGEVPEKLGETLLAGGDDEGARRREGRRGDGAPSRRGGRDGRPRGRSAGRSRGRRRRARGDRRRPRGSRRSTPCGDRRWWRPCSRPERDGVCRGRTDRIAPPPVDADALGDDDTPHRRRSKRAAGDPIPGRGSVSRMNRTRERVSVLRTGRELTKFRDCSRVRWIGGASPATKEGFRKVPRRRCGSCRQIDRILCAGAPERRLCCHRATHRLDARASSRRTRSIGNATHPARLHAQIDLATHPRSVSSRRRRCPSRDSPPKRLIVSHHALRRHASP